ncbi:MAG: TIM-barrel domain-containing protein [Planctomycetota bacterium]
MKQSQTPDLRTLECGVALTLPDATLQVDVLEAGILRVRKFPGAEPPEKPLIRYGLFRDEWPTPKFNVETNRQGVKLTTDLLSITIKRADGALTVRDAEGKELLAEIEASASGPDPGLCTRFLLPPDRAFFGLGDQTRERIEHRGTKADLWVINVSSYIPIPFVMTNDGLGFLVNTTRRILFDLGESSKEQFGFEAKGDTLDYYILRGASPAEIIGRYTEITGKPPMPPRWAMGLWFICRTQADAREFVDDCHAFRKEGIPCDAISLEPGWMAKNYDFSITKDWHPERFPVPSYARKGRHNFLSAARRMGFKPGLWLCCDYDLSYEEERRVKQAEAQKKGEEKADGGYEQDALLMKGARRMDPGTKPDVPWFEHLKDFVDQGVEWFKQDGANQVLTHPDRLWGNGMLDDEMHNLYPLLYSKQMYLGFREHTNRRPFCFTPAGWAGLQRWTGTWTGDTGGEENTLVACLNLSLSGHGMSTCDMEVTTKEGIHFGFLLPWAQLNSWNYFRHPWYQGEELQAIFSDYAKLRYRLAPYLYSVAWEAHTSGLPMLRAMPLVFPEDRETYGLLRQYMFGPAFLVGAFTEKVYLPEGDWYDYWTSEKYAGGEWAEPRLSARKGGPLFVRAGSIIPMGQDVDYIGQKPDDELTVHVYAGASGAFTFYEDDGHTFAYENGGFRATQIRQEAKGNSLRVEMSAAKGSYAGALPQRRLEFVIHGLKSADKVDLDGRELAQGVGLHGPFWTWDNVSSTVVITLGERDASRQTVVTVSS